MIATCETDAEAQQDEWWYCPKVSSKAKNNLTPLIYLVHGRNQMGESSKVVRRDYVVLPHSLI